MLSRAEQQLGERIDRVLALVQEKLDRRPGAEATAAFVRQYFERVEPDDVLGRSVENLYGAAVSLWRFAEKRTPGTARIRAYNPRVEQDGWASPHTVIEIVNDDMPFLVDSVTMALAGRGLGIHMVIHPIVPIARDPDGRRIFDPAAARPESLMHVEVDAQSDPKVLAEIASGLADVLADVRAAVTDWRAMRDKLGETLRELEATPPPLAADEVEETEALLQWMDDQHFTFLGYREYAFADSAREASLDIVEGSGLGILRSPERRIMVGREGSAMLTQEVRDFLRRRELLIITKANARATVHRPVHLDYVGVRRFDAAGHVIGERRFVGLFTSAAYSSNPREIPVLRRKVRRVVERAGLAPRSHDGKALLNILDTFPRDELFQIGEDDLFAIAHGILLLQKRPRTRLFLRRDEFGRFVSCLVFVPREHYDTLIRRRFGEILAEGLGGRVSTYYTQLGDEPLARIHYIIAIQQGAARDADAEALEDRLVVAARSWSDDLREALVERLGEEAGNRLWKRFGGAFPAGYRERYDPQTALFDICKIEALETAKGFSVNLYRPLEAAEGELFFKLYHRGAPIPLSDCLPMLENMGVKVMEEHPFEIAGSDAREAIWVHDFRVLGRSPQELDLGRIKPLFEEAFEQVWHHRMENDGFNRLVMLAGLSWREAVVLRAACKYLRQTGIAFSQAYMENTLSGNAPLARLLVELFLASFDPDIAADREELAASREQAFLAGLDQVESLDEDRILRRFLNLIKAIKRTNYFQLGEQGRPKPYLSFKLASDEIEELPQPRPFVEVFVYSPKVEAVHLRGGRVARGGIRWSDRREDFRTEVLGLMKAQMVKNAVIVPVGAKGGFVPKRPPMEAGREAVLADAVESYKTLIRGLLDLTDNRVKGDIVPPPRVVRHDGDDPYLVVAADKGTATFSDIANSVSAEYGFWLGDAFASGGSAGYDHKAMGITAKGAWELVKRHFRELGRDIQAEDLTVAGIGDMSGDVFGNGMLLSPHIRLIAAFDHRHIFLDPDPDPRASLAERNRLYELPRSSWADYNRELLSPGGDIFDRKAKVLRLSPQAAARLGLAKDTLTPIELMKAILTAEVDLFWNGGIGTYVKASEESHAEAGDRTNDAVRVNGKEVRARVIGEGGNLGFTQRGRIEFARAGGRINTDAIDNSAGVDCSDHEVNIKILLDAVVAEGELTTRQRDRQLAEMTDEVAELVLQDNYLQGQAVSLTEAQGPNVLPSLGRFMREMERRGRLDRQIEFLPDEASLNARQAQGEGLTRPEIAVLLAYAKTSLYSDLLDGDLPEDPWFAGDLAKYFPRPLRRQYPEAIAGHRLRREIIATAIVNSMINRVGPGFIDDIREESEATAADIARAYAATREIHDLRRLWTEIEALDNKVPAQLQTAMMLETVPLIRSGTLWCLRELPGRIDIAATIDDFAEQRALLAARLDQLLAEPARVRLAKRAEAYAAEGAPAALARAVASLETMMAAQDIIAAAKRAGQPVETVGKAYFTLGDRLGLDWLRQAAAEVNLPGRWQRLAMNAALEELAVQQRRLTIPVLRQLGEGTADPVVAVERWQAVLGAALARLNRLIAEFKTAGGVDAARLAIANRYVRALSVE